jgi:hypothetical protein
MTTCLDINTCQNNKLYNIRCNFITNYLGTDYAYVCNPHTTCMRADGTYDCCGDDIVECIVDASLLRVPTIQPSVAINNDTNCDKMCSSGNKIDTCSWYETLRPDNLCGENNHDYCCSHNSRADCCRTNNTDAYIVFGSIAGIMMIIFAYYWYCIKNTYHKIKPTQEV